MKILTKKGFVNKLIIVLLAVLIFGTIIPANASYAANGDNIPGGKLLKPLVDLLMGLGDFIMDLLHNVVYGMNEAIIKIDLDNPWWEGLWITVGVIVAMALVVAVGGGFLLGATKLLTLIGGALKVTVAGAISAAAIGSIIAAGGEGAFAAGMFVRSNWFSNEAVLPLYRISPEEIFSAQVGLLNANFFSKKEIEVKDTTALVVNTTFIEAKTVNMSTGMEYNPTRVEENRKEINEFLRKYGYSGDEIDIYNYSENGVIAKWETDTNVYQAEAIMTWEWDAIAQSDVISARTVNVYTGEWQGYTSIAEELKGTISKWYYAVRNLALVAMMIILLYIGIRIMLCGIANEKAKYKNMLVDWLVAICLIFVMHYIMVFAMNITDSIIELFSSVNNKREYIVFQENENGKITEGLIEKKNELGITEYFIKNNLLEEIPTTDENGITKNVEFVKWDAKNIMGLIRVKAALQNIANGSSYLYVGYVFCFVILVWYTLFFFVTYLKRILYLAFFTVIAPLVAMTYPLDKMHDGKAQAFDMWLKEYIFNLLIQPMHLLLYTVLINSAFELATTNVVYTLVAIGFMMPAEKFVRKMFGFDKAQTPGFLGGAAGAAVALTAFNKVLNRRHHSGGGKAQVGNGNDKADKGLPTNYTDEEGIDPILLGGKKAKASNQKALPNNVLSDETKKNFAMDIGKNAMTDVINSGYINVGSHNIPKTEGRVRLENDIKKAQQEAARKKALKKHRFRGIKNASKDYAKQKLQRAMNNINSGKPIRDFSRISRGLAVGAGTAMLGATLGIAADDPNKVLQYSGTLGAAGYALGARDRQSNVDQESIYEEYKRGLYENDEQYRQAMLEEQRAKVIENENNLRKLRENLRLNDLKEAQQKLEEYGDCIDAGITDMDDIATVVNLVEEENWDKDMAKTAAKYYKKVGGKPSRGKKERENTEFIFNNIAKAKGIENEEERMQVVRTMIDNVEFYGKKKDSLTDV